MCWLLSFNLFISIIFVFSQMKRISTESISSQKWSDMIQDLSLKKYPEKNIESHPLNEGFILLSDEHQKPPAKLKSIRIPLNNRTSKSNPIPTTTCRTIVIVTTKKPKSVSSPPIPDHSVGHLGRRLLNEPSYNTDLDIPSKQVTVDDDWKIDDFMKVDSDELSRQLFQFQTAMYGSGETTEETTEQTSVATITSIMSTEQTSESTTTLLTTTTSTTTVLTMLSSNTTFILELNCSNANETLNKILNELKVLISYDVLNISELVCNDSERVNITLDILTGNSIKELNDLFATLLQLADLQGGQLYSNNKCGNNGIKPVINVTSCHLIDLCQLCGTNPIRGVCRPEYNVSKCDCVRNADNPAKPYAGDICWPSDPEPIISPSIPSRWTPVIVGILAGLAGLFCVITCCLWTIAIWRRRSSAPLDLRIQRLWHLPRAQVPTSVTTENVQTYLDNTISTISSRQTDSDYNRSDTTDSTFFKELDQKMGENLRATITRPNTSAMLASLPSDTISTLSSYDPIDELDAIIDNEDLNTTFHDPLNELFEDNEPVEAINPNLLLSRSNIDSKPTGLFSFLSNNS